MAEAADEEVEDQPMGEEGTQVLYTTGSDSVMLPLLDKHQRSGDGIHKSDTQMETDGVELQTSVPLELGSCDGGDCGSSWQECPICSETLAWQGEYAAVLLHCNHVLCHHCTTGIQERARDPSRLRCPFCRQTTPFPQWEIQRLQEELYSIGGAFYDPPPLISLEPQAAPAQSAVWRQLNEWTRRTVCVCCVTGLRLVQRRLPLLLPGIGCILFGAIAVITVFQILKAV